MSLTTLSASVLVGIVALNPAVGDILQTPPENSFSAPAAEIGQEPETETKTIDAETDKITSVPLNDEKVNVVGVEWEGESPKPEIRYKENGKWSSWQSLEAEDGGPDAGTPDAQNATEATSAVVPIVNSEEVQVRSADKTADTESLEITTASTEVTEEDKTIASGTPGVTNTASITGQVGAFAAQTTDLNAGNVPTAEALAWNPELKANVVTRKEWGANEKQVKCGSSVASSNKGVIVHHTAGSNSYSRSQAPGIIRGYLTFHTQSKGWCDLGYNFLVDKYGTIYEGRAGSMDKAVVGAHASGFNTGTLGISVMGTYGSSAPPAAAQNSVARIAAWGANKWGYNPTGTMKMTSGGGGTSKYPKGRTVTLNVIGGHRDTSSTSCPGNAFYNRLGSIRTNTKNMQSKVEVKSPYVLKGEIKTYYEKNGGSSRFGLPTGNERRLSNPCWSSSII